MKTNLLIAMLMLLASAFAYSEESDTLWCKYTYPTQINVVKFSPDGTKLASGGSDGVVNIWNVLTGEFIKSYHPYPDIPAAVNFLDINNDGTLLTVFNYVYNLQTDSIIAKLAGSGKFSPDGNYLVTGGKIYETKTWSIVGTFPTYGSYPNGESIESLDISADNKYIATGSFLYKDAKQKSSIIRLFKLSNLQFTNEYLIDSCGSLSAKVCFSPDGNYLASSLADTIKIWTLPDRTIYKKFPHYSEIRSIMFSPDGKYLLTGAESPNFKERSRLYIWDFDNDSIINSYLLNWLTSKLTPGDKGGDGALSISVNFDSKYIAIGGGLGIYLLNANWNPSTITENIIMITNDTVYPNPSNNIANIKFNLIKSGYTTIKIYNSNSNEIITLYNDFLDVGLHTFLWKTSEITNGVYFCKISTNNFFSTIKIIVNK
jgi:WD40 repeat protein